MIKRKAKNPSRQAGTRIIEEIKFPKPEDWNAIADELKLDDTQLNELKIAIGHVVENIRDHRSKRNQEPERALLVTRLKRMERALGKLQREINSSIHLMDRFLPDATLEHIGLSFALPAIADVVGEKALGNPPPFMAALRQRTPIETAALEESRHRALGLKHGHQILKHFIDAIHAPLKKWVELDKLNKGGRPPAALARNYLIYRLAPEAPNIIGKPAAISTTGSFKTLCALLLPACGLSARGVEKAIPPMVRKVRAEQNRWRAQKGAS